MVAPGLRQPLVCSALHSFVFGLQRYSLEPEGLHVKKRFLFTVFKSTSNACFVLLQHYNCGP